MSDPSRPVSGFVPLGDMAAAVDLPGGRGLSPAPPQARHHFTTLHQVNQLVEASEADADLGFIARLLALCSLPRTNPGDRREYVRHNGPYTLTMTVNGNAKLPYGKTSRACSWPGSAPKLYGRNAASWSSAGRCYDVEPGVAVFLAGQFLISTSRIWFARMGVSVGLRRPSHAAAFAYGGRPGDRRRRGTSPGHTRREPDPGMADPSGAWPRSSSK